MVCVAYNQRCAPNNADLATGDVAPGHGERAGAGEAEADAVEPGTDDDPVAVPEPAEAAPVQDGGLHPRELEADMARDTVAGRQPHPVRVQVRAVQAPNRVPGDGLLCLRCQGRCRDPQAQHGPHPAARLPEYANDAQVHRAQPCHSLR